MQKIITITISKSVIRKRYTRIKFIQQRHQHTKQAAATIHIRVQIDNPNLFAVLCLDIAKYVNEEKELAIADTTARIAHMIGFLNA